MKISWKNIENWRSWKTRFFWGGHFEFSKSAILNFFLLHLCEKSSPFIWGIIFFCTMNGSSRILKKTSFQFFCTRLYFTTTVLLNGGAVEGFHHDNLRKSQSSLLGSYQVYEFVKPLKPRIPYLNGFLFFLCLFIKPFW